MVPVNTSGAYRAYDGNFIRFVLDTKKTDEFFPSEHFPISLKMIIDSITHKPFKGIAIPEGITPYTPLSKVIEALFVHQDQIGFEEPKYLTTSNGKEYDYAIFQYFNNGDSAQYSEKGTHVAIVTDRTLKSIHIADVQVYKMRIESKSIIETDDNKNLIISYDVRIGDYTYQIIVNDTIYKTFYVKKSEYSESLGQIVADHGTVYEVKALREREEILNSPTNDISAFSRALEKAVEQKV